MIDRYQIQEKLGEGGAGSVHKAWDKKLQRFVAVKSLLPPGERQTAGAGENLAVEAAALSALQHPNIVSVYDLDTDGPEPFVVMEFINGETLEATVRRGALLPADFLQIAGETLEGLVAAHRQGMCHRDLKPSNIMFHWLPDGKWQTKLLDFGLCNFGVRPAQQELTSEGSVAGSVHFMAPEQFLHQPLDVRTDLYSLGCVLYYSLTGSFPCNGATMEEITNAHLSHKVAPLHQLRPDVPRLLTDWVMWLMSRQPEERPESAVDALRVLRGIQSGETTTLPVQRALKTRQLNTGNVKEAPLGQDVAARARAAVTTKLPATRTGTAPTVIRPAGAIRRPAAAAPRTPTRPVKKTPKKKSTAPVIALVSCAVLATGAAIYFLTRDGNQKKGSENRTVESPPPSALDIKTGPPEKGLVAWLDAAKGPRTGGGKTDAKPGDRVDQWNDRATFAGNNPAQYHPSSSPSPERAMRHPLLAQVTDKDGLKGTHAVVQFSGTNCLVFARDADKIGDPVSKELSGNQISWIAVFSADPAGGDQVLLAAEVGSEDRAWDTFVRDGYIFSGVRKRGGGENHASMRLEPRAGFHILAVVWDGSRDSLREWVTGPDGRTAQSSAISGTTDFGGLSEVRIGARQFSGGKPMEKFLKGGIASLLFYNRALEDSEREAAVDYLSRRYFGVPAPGSAPGG
jgi:hypothetical protein